MIGLSSSNICNLNLTILISNNIYIYMYLLWQSSMEKLNNDDARVVGSKYRVVRFDSNIAGEDDSQESSTRIRWRY